MKILNSTGCNLAVFIKFGDKELPRFNTMNANSEMTILGNLGIDYSIGLYSLDSQKSIVIKFLTNKYSIEERNGFVLEELGKDKLYGSLVQILSASNFS